MINELRGGQSRPVRAHLSPLSAHLSQLLEQSPLRQRDAGAVADDDVIEQTNVHQREGLLDPLGDQLVRAARLGDARRMVVSENH